MQSAPSQAAADTNYPPLPQSGPPEDSDFAYRNFTERERLSKSWRARLFSRRRAGLSLLEKRVNSLHASNSSSDISVITLDSTVKPLAAPMLAAVSEPGLSRRSESTETGRISLRDPDEDDPTKDQYLYRWAMVYENQRGISIFSARRYSSQSLLPRDPPAFSVVAPAVSTINGHPVRKSLQPDISLEDFPLPDGNWRWASKEWMVDMRGENVQHDGFEYNWLFRSKGWRSTAGRLNSGAWVRRRRWIRLMERPPLSALKPEEGVGHVTKLPTTESSTNLGDVWCGDGEDWSRLRVAMRELDRDGRKLDAWKDWMRTARRDETEKLSNSNSPISESMAKVLQTHMSDLLRSFVYPSSRIEFLQMMTKGGLVTEEEVVCEAGSRIKGE